MTAGHRSPAKSGSKKSADRATRFSAELFEAAQTVGEKQNRSARQQLEYWAEIGRTVTAPDSAAQSRIEAAFAGRLSRQDLTPEEVKSFDAQLDARAARRMNDLDYPAQRAAAGHRSIHMDTDGNLIETRADGTTRVLE